MCGDRFFGISHLILITILIFKHTPKFIDDFTLWIEYCYRDIEFCPQCFNNTEQYTFKHILITATEFEPNINQIFGRRKVQRIRVKSNGLDLNGILKYSPSNNDDFLKQIASVDSQNHNVSNKYSIKFTNNLATELFSHESSYTNTLKICPTLFTREFFKTFHNFPNNHSFWMHFAINPELVVLQAIHNAENKALKNVVPKLYDFHCGFVTVEEDSGRCNLLDFYTVPLKQRIYLAEQLLQIATSFSYGINGFRIYLTDITPDNFAVDQKSLRVTFVDLDNIFIVNSELIKSNAIQRHDRIKCEQCFAFIPQELCSYQLSDINIYSVCQIFLEVPVGGPINGLLNHDAPVKLLTLIEHCLNCDKYKECQNRFVVANKIMIEFRNILNNNF